MRAGRFRSSREPEILDRANRRIEIDRRVGLASKPATFGAIVIASDADVDRRFQNARQLQAVIERPLFALIRIGCTAAGLFEIVMNGFTD